ncbi:hypothetical protein [Streptomyces sp. NPDC059717]|uniref:hypothetical protein n=1 Tax=Streptomyces sp. NPDC059717 TaxID=3346922 RepID=UPI0036AC3B83
MSDSPPESTTGTSSDRGTAPAAPRWVKFSGIGALTVVILFLVLHLSGAMGPGMHGGH